MDNRDFKGVWIPKEIWLCKDLTALDRVIYAEIDSLDNENHCTAGNEYFADFCGVGEATITRSIQKLIDKGYIEKVSFDGRHRTLKVIKQSHQNDEAPSSKRFANNIVNNQNSNINTIPINRNSSDLSDFESHSYSPKEMREDFLGSIPKQKKTKKPSLYDKCADEVLCYTKNLSLQDKLLDYLGLRLNMKDKPLVGVNQWKGMLNKLSDISGEMALDKKADKRIKIVEQSIERGWAAFFEIKNDSYREDCAAFGPKNNRVKTEPSTTTAEERKAILEKQGKRSSF